MLVMDSQPCMFIVRINLQLKGFNTVFALLRCARLQFNFDYLFDIGSIALG